MTNQELLTAMSDMMDEKLDTRDEKLKKTMSDIMDEKLEPLKVDIADMKEDISDLKTRVTKLEVDNETIIIPGINELRAAYNSEFDKYQVSIEDHERLVTDVDALKTVVPHHSEQIAELQQVCGL
ncbi:MAG: hypothetical protein PUB24_07040 [Lachnospiraceae bacterium]|nr:hypothetical protein [Lachnospiraceae bacterium]